jgi:hypothetical protein
MILRNRSTCAFGIPTTSDTSRCIASPVVASISKSPCLASARKAGSRTMASNAERSAADPELFATAKCPCDGKNEPELEYEV